jgi:hypothetical protein
MAEVKILKRRVTDAMKKRVAGIQRFTCSGNVSGYKCPLNGLPFDESGYDIDHIKPLSEGGTNETSNLQALCLMCHRVKSNRAASGNVKPAAVKKEAVKKVVEPKPAPLKKFYSVDLASGFQKKFDDLDTLMQFVDRLVTKEGWTGLSLMMFRVHIPVGDKMVERLEMFPSPNDRSSWGTMYGYKL